MWWKCSCVIYEFNYKYLMKCCCLCSITQTLHELHADIDWQQSPFKWHYVMVKTWRLSKFACRLALCEYCRWACTIVSLHFTATGPYTFTRDLHGDEKHFHVSRTCQCCYRFMKMLVYHFDPSMMATPRIHCNGLLDRSSDPTQEANRTGCEDSFWLRVPHSFTCFSWRP